MDEVWTWWLDNGDGVQQLFSIVFTSVATMVGLIGLSTWKKQLRATAAREIIESAVLVCDYIRIERLRPEPMVYLSGLADFGERLATVRQRINKERESWELFSSELKERTVKLKICSSKNSHLLTGNFAPELDAILKQVSTVETAVKNRVAVLGSCRNSSHAEDYRPLVGLRQLYRNNPVLCGPNNQFEVDIRKAMDGLRAAVLKFN